MKNLIIAAAQSASKKGDIEANISHHLEFAEIAKKQNASFIIFPELSLTGYEPELAKEAALSADSIKLKPLSDFAVSENLIIAAGVPVRSSSGKTYIGLLCFLPDGKIGVHTKEHLHHGEEKFFIPGQQKCSFNISGEKVSLAVCADIGHKSHPQNAAENGATVYAASVLLTEKGYLNDSLLLKEYSARYNMLVLMSNHSINTGGWETAGNSGFWFNGRLVKSVQGTNEALSIAKKSDDGWIGNIISLKSRWAT